jgi:hypothetical protein
LETDRAILRFAILRFAAKIATMDGPLSHLTPRSKKIGSLQALIRKESSFPVRFDLGFLIAR